MRALAANDARFVVIGGFALILHGGRHTTMDSDFAIASDPQNASAVAHALAQFHPEPTHLPPGAPFVWDERSIRGVAVSLRTDCGDVGLFIITPGIDSFEGLLARSIERTVEGVVFRVASVEDLIAMKKEAGRPQDLIHLDELERIKKASA